VVSVKTAGFLFALCDLCGNIIFVFLGVFAYMDSGKGREQERKLCKNYSLYTITREYIIEARAFQAI